MNSTTVVGIHNGHNAAAAVVRDGELLFALQEERLTRVKNQGGLPKKTLAAIAEKLVVADDASGTLPVGFGGENLTKCEWRRDAILASYGSTSRSAIGQVKTLARKSAAVSHVINRFKLRNLEAEIATSVKGAK